MTDPLSKLISQVLDAQQAAGEGELVRASLEAIAHSELVDGVQLACQGTSGWEFRDGYGEVRNCPSELLGNAALDFEIHAQNGWMARTLRLDHAIFGQQPRLMLVHGGISQAQFECLAAMLEYYWGLDQQRRQAKRLALRLETILQIAEDWHDTESTKLLLERMAQAATDLLAADRASIFLWDRGTHTLVGRPAMGINASELRIPDDAGVVGQVVKDQIPARVGLASPSDPINRDVDQQTGYDTRTLLCVPLLAPEGKCIGAFEVLNKESGDFTDDDERCLQDLARHAAIAILKTQRLEKLIASHQKLVDQAAGGVQLVGECQATEALRSTVSKIAATDLAILILGENGTGKEVVARQIHYQGNRREEPFIAINCAAISETLLESELFGHEKGAFTDAREQRIGKFELASQGTLFLDEIGDLSPAGQAKLLRVLEEKTFFRVGGSEPITTQARILAATNKNLAERVQSGNFRQDLFFRLNVVTLEMPPLRERGRDILLLADHFIRRYCRELGRPVLQLTAEAEKKLLQHTWPGNVRELRNLFERIVYLHAEDQVDAADIVFSTSAPRGSAWEHLDGTLAEATKKFQSLYIDKAIEQMDGNVSEAAGMLGLHRSNLYRKMKQLEQNSKENTDD